MDEPSFPKVMVPNTILRLVLGVDVAIVYCFVVLFYGLFLSCF